MSATEPARLLVVDDDEMALVITRKLLEAESFTVDVSLSGREALTLLAEKRYDAILCDMWMSGMTGKEFYNHLCQDFPEYRRSIIFITGDIASEATWEFIDERKLPYVLKPFSRPELRRKLQEVIGERATPPRPESVTRAAEAGINKRRHRRIAMKANIRVRRKKWAVGGPDVNPVVNASKEGVYFLTDREYRIGTEVMVAFPYTGYNDVEQEGYVVRVEEKPEGRRGVALALGEAAANARAAFAGSEEDRRRHHILTMADLSVQKLPTQTWTDDSAAARINADRQETRRLSQELNDLKSTYDRVADQRDRLASEEARLQEQLKELNAAKAAMTQVVDDLRTQMEGLQKELATTEDFRYQATHDALTGVWNRGAIFDILKRELIRADREASAVGVILADLDHFKKVNDTFGHLSGDIVLKEAAQRITSAVREYDAVGRYGGEEFLIVLSGCDEANTVNQAERIRTILSAATVQTSEAAIPITLSLGAASSIQFKEMEAILRAADAALYRAKRNGRNQVVAASSDVP